MKKSLLSVILLIIAWAVSATAVTTPLSSIVRLEAAVCKYEYTGKPVLEAWDYSTSYTYDRNANITSLSRQGIVDRTILGNNVFGLHSRYTMKYAVNRLSSMEIEREGEDYEGRTGVSATGKISDFWYDANGNLGRDMSRGILSTEYNRLDLPTDVYFINGHRQTIEYDGFGQKRRVSYSQTSDPILGSMMGVPEDSAYTLQGRRDYIGPHVFVGDSLEYSAFPGGYFTPEGVFYYITDWQGNNIAVFSDKGELVQQTSYYLPLRRADDRADRTALPLRRQGTRTCRRTKQLRLRSPQPRPIRKLGFYRPQSHRELSHFAIFLLRRRPD